MISKDGTQSAPSGIYDLLRNAAMATPDNGLTYLNRGLSEQPAQMSYSQLYRQAQVGLICRRINTAADGEQKNASRLLATGVLKPGQTVITYFDSHQENVIWFWSVVAAGGICAINNPISNENRTAQGQLDNLRALFGDATVLTNHRLAAVFASRGLNVRSIEGLKGRSIVDSEWSAPQAADVSDPDKIAAILFTSGSTGHSKAVKLSHGQLIASVQAKSSYLATRGMSFMSWVCKSSRRVMCKACIDTPVAFDHSACFCEIHLQALYNGSDQLLVAPSDMIIEPFFFFEALSAYKIGYTFSPNFFLAAATECLARKDPSTISLDLSHLRVIMCGGEANRTKTLVSVDSLLRRYGAPPHTIKAAYGLSETCSACFYNLESPEYDIVHNNSFASVGKVSLQIRQFLHVSQS
jgi:acyl-CoA synthetase (AMP-forming)/AMP-acid ligase II